MKSSHLQNGSILTQKRSRVSYQNDGELMTKSVMPAKESTVLSIVASYTMSAIRKHVDLLRLQRSASQSDPEISSLQEESGVQSLGKSGFLL